MVLSRQKKEKTGEIVESIRPANPEHAGTPCLQRVKASRTYQQDLSDVETMSGQRQEKRNIPNEEESYLNLKLLGRVTTYAIIVMITLGLAFLTGVIIWLLRRIFGV